MPVFRGPSAVHPFADNAGIAGMESLAEIAGEVQVGVAGTTVKIVIEEASSTARFLPVR